MATKADYERALKRPLTDEEFASVNADANTFYDVADLEHDAEKLPRPHQQLAPRPPPTHEQFPTDTITAYKTELSPNDEAAFQIWAKQNHTAATPDYDMRGYWKAQAGAPHPGGHFPDTYKTPKHETFSNESIYAGPDAPHWEGPRLFDDKHGIVIADETPRYHEAMGGENALGAGMTHRSPVAGEMRDASKDRGESFEDGVGIGAWDVPSRFKNPKLGAEQHAMGDELPRRPKFASALANQK